MPQIIEERKHISINDILGDSSNEINNSFKDNHIVLLPEIHMGKECFNKDLINLVKILRKNGCNVNVFNPNGVDIVEKRSVDISLILGIIIDKAILPLALGIIGSYIYDTYVKVKPPKNDMPKIKLEYYQKENEEYVKYEGPADKLAEELQKIKETKND